MKANRTADNKLDLHLDASSDWTVEGIPGEIYLAHKFIDGQRRLEATLAGRRHDPALAATEVTLALLRANNEFHRTAWTNAKPGDEFDRQAAYFETLWRAKKLGWKSLGKLALYHTASGRKGKNVAKGFKVALKRRGLDWDTLDRPEKKLGAPKGGKRQARKEKPVKGLPPNMV